MIDAAGLRVMRAIAEQGSFTAAAASLGYSQPAISQMVRRLEERTGTLLVERLGRSVRLTEAGQVLANHAVPVLAALEQAEAQVSAIAGLKAGRVRLMAFPSASSTLVPRALALVRERYPEVTVTFAEGEPPQSLAALRDGECDLAVAFVYDGDELPRHESDLDAFVVEDLLTERVRVVVSREHRLAESESLRLGELAEDPWIAGCPRCRAHLLTLAEREGFTPRVGFETEDYVAVMGLVAEGLGVALVPDLILRSIQHPEVVALQLEPDDRRTVQVVTTPDLRRVPAVEATLTALHDAAATAGVCSGPAPVR